MFAVYSAMNVWPKPQRKDVSVLASTCRGHDWMFSLGFCLGKVWEACSHKEGQRQKNEVIIKTGVLHKEGGLKAKDEFIGKCEREGDVTVFLTKTGTKVHLIKDCPGLINADLTQMKRTTICAHCLKIRRLALLKSD